MSEIAKISSKGQVTVPARIRRRLDVRPGDTLAWEVQSDGRILVRRVTPVDVDYLDAVSGTLSEWNTAEDEEAYGGL